MANTGDFLRYMLCVATTWLPIAAGGSQQTVENS